LAHPGPGIAVNHPAKIKARSKTESVLYAKSAASAGSPLERRFSESFDESRLANAGARKAAVVFHANLAAAEQIGDRSDGFLRVFGAGTDREDQIAEGQCAWLEDLAVLFHRVEG
jgi:hypothetical protein